LIFDIDVKTFVFG